MNPFVGDLLYSLIAGLFVFAALRDVATRTVPNWVSFAILAFGIVLQSGADRIFTSTALGSLVFMALLPMWYRGWLGGADVKLLAAGAVAVAPTSVTHFLFTVSLTGGVVAILYLALSLLVRRPSPGARSGFLARVLKAEAWRIHKRGRLPYATAIAAGCLFTLIPG